MEITLRRKPGALLQFEDGSEIFVTRLGKGHYSEVWRNGQHAYAFTKPDDIGKHALTYCDPMPHLPAVERIGMRGDDFVFKMPLYEKLTAKHREAWGQFRTLEKCREWAWGKVIMPLVGREQWWYWGYQVCERTIEAYRDDLGHDPAIADALQELADAGSLFGSTVCFEFAKRNLAVDSEGRLILLDCLFDLEKIQQEQAEQRRRHRGY